MTLVELIKHYNKLTDSRFMYDILEMMSEEIDGKLDELCMHKLMKCVYCKIEGCHYNEGFADEQVAKMYYIDSLGIKRYGPFISKAEAEEIYYRIKNLIKDYNLWDFYVTLQMIYSDNYNLLLSWFGDIAKEQLVDRVVEMSINWLKDNDNPYGDHKIWGYFNEIK